MFWFDISKLRGCWLLSYSLRVLHFGLLLASLNCFPKLLLLFAEEYLGVMPSTGIKPRRFVVPQQETSKKSSTKPYKTFDAKHTKEDIQQGHRLTVSISKSKTMASVNGENQEDASFTPASGWGSTVTTVEENFEPFDARRYQPELSTRSENTDKVASDNGNVLTEVQKKVHFSIEDNATFRGKLVFQCVF